MPEGVQHDFASKNIVTRAVIPRAYAPWSFTELQTGELLYLVASVAVVGIVAENLNQFFEGADRGGVFPGFPLEPGGGEEFSQEFGRTPRRADTLPCSSGFVPSLSGSAFQAGPQKDRPRA